MLGSNSLLELASMYGDHGQLPDLRTYSKSYVSMIVRKPLLDDEKEG